MPVRSPLFIALLGVATVVTGRICAQNVRPFAPGVISTRLGKLGGADAPAFTPDGKTVIFDRTSIRQGSTLYISHFTGGHWSTPQTLPFSGLWIDQDPSMAPDGSYLIFASNRPHMAGGTPLPGWQCNLWRVARRRDGSWGRPVWLPASINRPGHSLVAPSIARDGTLYFLDHAAHAQHGHAVVSYLRNGQYTAPAPVVFTGEPGLIPADIAIAPDQSFMIFDVLSKDHSVFYRAQRRQGAWMRPVRMGADVNASQNWDPRISPDGRTLYFSSLRGGYTAIWFLRLSAPN